MAQLWDAARSYALQNNLSPNQKINPADLKSYFRSQDLPMRCPLGTNAYESFTLRNGPRCPHSVEHNRNRKPPANLQRVLQGAVQ
jgi:hypothetical protein